MRKLLLAVLFSLLLAVPAMARESLSVDDKNDVLQSLQGEYVLVGKKNKGGTYSGKLTMVMGINKLDVVKILGSKRYIGSATIINDTPDNIPVLVIEYGKGKAYGYLWKYDMNNDPIIFNALSPASEDSNTDYETLYFRKWLGK